MNELNSRDIQTKVKHEILERYLRTWGGIITQGLLPRYQQALRQGWAFHHTLIYVDCFSHTGRYLENGQIVDGSPIIGIKIIDEIQSNMISRIGFQPQVFCVLIEEDKAIFDTLIENLYSLGYGDRVKQGANLSALQNGDIAVLNTDSTSRIDELLSITSQPYTKSFYLLDPYGPTGIPLERVVAPIVSQAGHDVMINLPWQDFIKKALSHNPIHDPHRVHYDRMYGNSSWREIIHDYEKSNDTTKDNLEGLLVDMYQYALQITDDELGIKSIRLKFPERERTMFYLFLTTHDPTGALALNKILDEANYRQFELRQLRRHTKRGYDRGLFDDFNLSQSNTDEVDIDGIADQIYTFCKGEQLEFREVLRRMIASPYYPGDLKSAMSRLKRNNRASYLGTLRNSSEIRFK